MLIYEYDGTFEGFLTCVFDSYSRKESPRDIYSRKLGNNDLFAEKYDIITDSDKAERVWRRIQDRLSANNKQLLFYAFLSQEKGIEMTIFRFIRKMMDSHHTIESDFGDEDVLQVSQISAKVKKETMRMMQFVRFQNTKDGLYFCGIEPRYDVIPLVVGHFKERFKDQAWLLYDLKRNFGILYEKGKLEEVVISNSEFSKITGQINSNVLKEGEEFYQNLWKSYFKNINIKERKNLRLQRQHMPKRFWKYLPEIMNGM